MVPFPLCSHGWLYLGVALCAAVALLAGAPAAAAAREPLLSREGHLLVGDNPRFVIGLYELPSNDDMLRTLAGKGFDLIRVPDKQALDRVHRHGFYGWMCVDARLGTDDGPGRQRLRQLVESVRDHPGLLVWELPDEILWNVWCSRMGWAVGEQSRALRGETARLKATASSEKVARWRDILKRADDLTARGLHERAEALWASLWRELGKSDPHPDDRMSQRPAIADSDTEQMARGVELLRQLDPKHLVWQNHAPRNSLSHLRRYNRRWTLQAGTSAPCPSGEPGTAI